MISGTSPLSQSERHSCDRMCRGTGELPRLSLPPPRLLTSLSAHSRTLHSHSRLLVVGKYPNIPWQHDCLPHIFYKYLPFQIQDSGAYNIYFYVSWSWRNKRSYCAVHYIKPTNDDIIMICTIDWINRIFPSHAWTIEWRKLAVDCVSRLGVDLQNRPLHRHL